MMDEDITLNEDQLLDNLDDTNGEAELLNEVGNIFWRLNNTKTRDVPIFVINTSTSILVNLCDLILLVIYQLRCVIILKCNIYIFFCMPTRLFSVY